MSTELQLRFGGGTVERFSPLAYDWSLYEELFKLISDSGLKLHVALPFHSNVNSSSSRKGGVTLPLWIIEVCFLCILKFHLTVWPFIGKVHMAVLECLIYPVILCCDNIRNITHLDYLTLGVDHVPLFCAGLLSNVMKISCQVLLRNLNP